MNNQTKHVDDKPGETSSESHPPQNTDSLSLLYDISRFCIDYGLSSDLYQHLKSTVNYIDHQTMLIDQKNAVLDLKMSECRELLAESLNSIKSIHTDIMNSKNHKTMSVRAKQNKVLDSNQTNNVSQGNILIASVDSKHNIEDPKQVNIEKMVTKQELEILEHKRYLDLIAWQSNIEELTIINNSLKSENVMLLEKLNESNVMLNIDKEITSNLKDKSNKKSVDRLNETKDHIELMNMLKASDLLNGSLKKDNSTLQERIKCLEKTNIELMDAISNKEITIKKIQIEKDIFNDLIKMKEEKLMDLIQQLEQHKKKENKMHSEVMDLKNEIEEYKNTIVNLQNEGKDNNILIPELKIQIDDLNGNLNNANNKLRDSSYEILVEKNKLEKENIALKQQNQEHLNEIKKLRSSYTECKSKVKRLQEKRSRKTKEIQTQLFPSEVIEIITDGEDNIDSSSTRKNKNSNHSNNERTSSFVDKSLVKKCRTAENPATSQGK